MSLKTIKTNLEQYLYANLTDVAIKAFNASVYTLNNVTLTPGEVNDLIEFVEPRVVSISQDRDILNNAEPFRTRAFFQVKISTKQNLGLGDSLTIEETLNSLFREKFIGMDNIRCQNTSIVPTFQEGEYFITTWRVESDVYNA